MKLAWTGDVLPETSAEGDPESNGAAESSVNVVKRACQIDQAGGGIRRGLCRMPPACTVGLWWVETARQHTKEMWEGALLLPWRSSVGECGGCRCSHPMVVWALWIHDLSKEGSWDPRMDRIQ